MTARDGGFKERSRSYWNSIAARYRSSIRISTDDFHYGPLIPGDSKLKLLPRSLKGLRCLELGCGRAQNSVFLAKRGAVCSASDISESQLEGAASLAKESGVEISFLLSPMEDIEPEGAGGPFDLVHSAYAVDFCEDVDRAVKTMAALLKPGGLLLLSTGHPLFSGEWLELESGAQGLFLKDYFNPRPDVRRTKEGAETVRSTFRPLSATAGSLLAAGLALEAFLEPQAQVPQKASPEELDKISPYWSRGWLTYAKELSKTPVVAIFKCRRPA